MRIEARHRGLLEIVAVAYACAVALAWLGDPLAMAPQLDARENLLLAGQIAQGALQAEPFYRAMLYPWLLSLLPLPGQWPQAAVLAGLLLHLVAALQTRWIARRVWESAAAGTLAFLLYLLNPASLFYALQPLDMMLGIALFLGALQCCLAEKAHVTWRLAAAGLLAGAACLARPHFLPAALLLALVPVVLGMRGRATGAALALLGVAVALCAQGVANLVHCGEFRLLPWQGGYNLYSANRAGASGLYYTQTIDVSGETFTNPARAESELVYARETGAAPTRDIEAFNRFWRDRTLAEIGADPSRWLGLLAFKAYAVLNSYEQYNNLTFGFHKARLPLLRYNLLNWGILLVAGAAGWMLLLRRNPRAALVVALLILGYAVSLLMYYASARFRLPLVPLVAVLAGGLALGWRPFAQARRTAAVAVAAAVLAAVAAFTSFGRVRDESTHVQDRLLLANANATLGLDAEAARWALQVLAEQPLRREALRVYTVSYFNLRLTQSPGAEPFGGWDEQRGIVTQTPPTDPVQDAILGVYAWQWGEGEQAAAVWRRIAAAGGPGSNLARACLGATGLSAETPPEAADLKQAMAALLRANPTTGDQP